MARLRRSARVSGPAALTKIERFEKLISFVREKGTASHYLRQFNVPNSIFASDSPADQSQQSKSRLECLSIEILLVIVDELYGNEQIMLALTCKTMAKVIEACPVRKIANISEYALGPKDPAYFLAQNISADLKPFGLSNNAPKFCGLYRWRPYELTRLQSRELNAYVKRWLGDNFTYCMACGKFRQKSKEWWIEFAEYENPGVTQAPKTAKKFDRLIGSWHQPTNAIGYYACPAHGLLKEKRGKRLL